MSALWAEFAAKPLIWLIITVAVFLLAARLNRRLGGTPILHPVLVSLSVIIAFLLLTGTPYETYFEGAQFIHFLLGPATVALAIPLYDHFGRVKKMLFPLIVACVVGAITAAGSAILIAQALGAADGTLLSIAPKSVTSPIAIGIAEKIGGYPSLASGLVLVTGAIGCVLAPPVYRILNVQDEAVKGFGLGVAGHGMGTAFAFQYGAMAGAFGGLAMGMTGAFTAFMLPILITLLGVG